MDKVVINKDKTRKKFKQPFKFEKSYDTDRGCNQTMDNFEIQDQHIEERFVDPRFGGNKGMDKVIIKKADDNNSMIYYYEINKNTDMPLLQHLEWDQDKSDLRLWYDNIYSFWETDEIEYKNIEKQLDDFEIKNEYYTIYFSYDVGGYDYWVNNMSEPTRVFIVISFEKEKIPVSILDSLQIDLEKAIDFIEVIYEQHPYMDSKEALLKKKAEKEYWTISDSGGEDEKVDFETFKYYHDEFGRTFLDKEGREHKRGEIPIEKVTEVYNPQGVLIAWMTSDDFNRDASIKKKAEGTDIVLNIINDTVKYYTEQVEELQRVAQETNDYTSAQEEISDEEISSSLDSLKETANILTAISIIKNINDTLRTQSKQ